MRRARRAANGRDRAIGQRHPPGDGHRRQRRGRGGRQNHRRQRRHGPDPHRHLRRQRRIRRPVDSDRAIYGDGRSCRVQDAGALEHRARRRPAGADRSQARSRRAHRVGHHRSRQSAPPDLVVRAGDDGEDRAAPGDAAQRPQFREPHALGPGRPARHSRRQYRRRRQPGVASLGIVLRQRSTRARQQLHARRRRQQRDLAADGRHFPQRRCAGRVQTADVHLLGGIRPVARRRRQPADQVGHQHAARQRLRVPPQRRVRRQQLLQQPCGAGKADVRTEPVRRDPRRRVVSRQDVLLRRISGASGESGTHVPVDGAVRGHAFGQLLRADPRHLRPDHRAAVPGQHHSRRPDRYRRPQHPHAALSRTEPPGHAQCEHGTDDRQLPDQSDQAASGQPVRRESRPQPVGEQQVLHTLQLPEDASHPAGHAGAWRRGGDVRRWRGRHQGAEPGVQRYAHAEQPVAERVPLRLVVRSSS